MVIVIVDGGSGAGDLAQVLASTLGWPHLEGGHLRPTVARAVSRREDAVVSSRSLPDRERVALHDELRAVRFVYVQDGSFADDRGELSSAIRLSPGTPAGEAVAAIRREFGV